MEHPGRIMILPSWYPPDGGYFFKEHSEAIHQKGWQVDVLVNRVVGARKLFGNGFSAIAGYRINNEQGLRVVRSVFLKLPGNEKINIRRWASSTRRLFDRFVKTHGKPDLILAHSVTWAGYAASLISRKHNIPYLIVEHRSFFVWSTQQARQMVKPFYLPFFEQGYRNCARLVPVSESLLTGLRSLMPWIDMKVEVIPNMIREEMFLPPPHPRETEPFVFFWAGRLEHVKGVDLLLQAVSELKKRLGSTFRVRLAGRGSLRDMLEQQARDGGISDMVAFLGRISREEIQKEMQQANCFVLPTRYEAFGAVLIEAMSAGLPVIATRSGGPQHIVNDANGLLIDPEDVSQLAGAMERMMKEYPSFDPSGIRSDTLERFGERRIMDRYHKLFLEITVPSN
jgi:glycosyltransferase involved in cell wall biosynthesis